MRVDTRKKRIYSLADYFNGMMDQIGQFILANLIFSVPALIFAGAVAGLSFIVPMNIFVVFLFIPLMSPFTAGLFYIARKLTLKEKISAWKDFKKGMKDEWKPFVINSLAAYVICCGIYITMQIYRGGLSHPVLLASFIMSLVFVLFFVCFENAFLTMLVTVDIKPTQAVKNAVLMFIGGFFYHLKVILSLVLVVFLVFSVYTLIGDVFVATLAILIPFILIIPLTCAYIIVYNIFQTIEKIIVIPYTSENSAKSNSDNSSEADEQLDLSELEQYRKGDPEEYVFVGGRMLKRKNIVSMLEENGR